MTVKEIIKDYLEKNGYDGLCRKGGCGCGIEDFMPCGMFALEGTIIGCKPAYKHKTMKKCVNCAEEKTCELVEIRYSDEKQ